jgi:ectoine hydroxylase-related dioxygenase (phytanoyl-CoA dioxygenase family)
MTRLPRPVKTENASMPMDIHSAYDRDGYVFPIDVLAADKLAHYRAHFAALEEEIGRERTQITLSFKESEHPFIWELATEPAVLDAVAAAYGEDLILTGTHFFCKYPAADMGRDAYVAWHQDVTYWGYEPPQAITAWIALDDVDAENGAMEVVPGSHRRGLIPHAEGGDPDNLLSVGQEVPVSAADRAAAATVSLRAGQMSLHDGLLLHGSAPNRSSRRRCGLTARFIRPDVRIDTAATRAPWRPVCVRGDAADARTALGPPPFPLR